MIQSHRLISRFVVFFSLVTALILPLAAHAALRLVLQLSMVEYAYPAARTGTIKIYVPDVASPFRTDPSMRMYDTGLWVMTDWNGLGSCNSSFLAGGHQEGWLLGPETNISSIRGFHPTANVAYGILTGYFGDTGYAYRYSCSGTRIAETSAVLYAFLLPQSVYVSGQGYHVGDAWYSTDYNPSGNWYYLYSPTPL